MAPEYGATCGFFPIDGETLRYLRTTGRDDDRIALVEAYAKENGMWRGADYDPIYTDTLRWTWAPMVPAISGPKRPQDYVALTDAKAAFAKRWRMNFKPLRMGKGGAAVETAKDYTHGSSRQMVVSSPRSPPAPTHRTRT